MTKSDIAHSAFTIYLNENIKYYDTFKTNIKCILSKIIDTIDNENINDKKFLRNFLDINKEDYYEELINKLNILYKTDKEKIKYIEESVNKYRYFIENKIEESFKNNSNKIKLSRIELTLLFNEISKLNKIILLIKKFKTIYTDCTLRDYESDTSNIHRFVDFLSQVTQSFEEYNSDS